MLLKSKPRIKISPGHLGLIFALFFISGASGLIYEVGWMRLLSLVFGVTAIATSIILASFMGGLAAGSYIFGRLADSRKRPLRLYGLLEIGVGLFALLMPLILSGLDNLYIVIYRQFGASLAAVNIFRFVLSFMAFLLPATLMGGTLPIISRFVVNRWKHLGERVGQLYFINTLGAAVGTLATGFVFILFLGVREATYLAAGLSILIGLVALVLDSRTARLTQPETPDTQPEDQAPSRLYSPNLARLSLAAFAVGGFCSIALEVLWTRSLVFILDNTSQAFTTMLTAFLLGIALGSLIMGRFVDRIKRPILWLGAIIAGIGLTALVSVPVFINLGAEIGGTFYQPGAYWQWAALRFGRSFLVMLVPTLLMGMAFPLVTRIYARSPKVLGRAIGNVYSLNTVAGVAGSLVAGFVLIPVIGVYYSVVIMAGIYGVMGIVLLLADPALKIAGRLKTSGAAFAALAIVVIGVTVPGQLMFSSAIETRESQSVVFYDEGIGSTVKVYDNAFGYRYLSIDGFPVASSTPRHRDIQKALGHFPLLLSPVEKPRVCVIGLGAGGSSWAATRYDIEALDVVELVPSVVEAAKLLPEVNADLFNQPELNIILADGRNYLKVSGEKYDVISVDATSPKSAGSGSLYSLEFYQSCRQSLSAEGVIVQWLPFHLLSPDEIDMTLNTFKEVFPATSVWFSPFRNYLVIAGSMGGLSIDFQDLAAKMGQPEVSEDLELINVNDPYDFLACFVMAGQTLDEFTGSTALNSDDHPHLEYSPTMAYFAPVDFSRENMIDIAPFRTSILDYVENMGPEASDVEANIAERFNQTPVERYWPMFFE